MLAQYDPNMIWRDESRKKSQAWMRFPVLGLKLGPGTGLGDIWVLWVTKGSPGQGTGSVVIAH